MRNLERTNIIRLASTKVWWRIYDDFCLAFDLALINILSITYLKIIINNKDETYNLKH